MTDTQITPPPAATPAPFSDLPLPPAMLAILEQMEYRQMTPIQAASLPPALAGQDVIAQAKTGSGKTAAFGLALLNRLKPRRYAVQALVLCPTRELAEQVTQEVRRLARFADNVRVIPLCGGRALKPQMESLDNGVHIVIGTPGRVLEHLNRGSLKLDDLNTLVLDEADRMLDMGFLDDVASIARQCPRRRQTLLFSATFPAGISSLAEQFMNQPAEVRLAEQHAETTIRQRYYEVPHDQRLAAVATLLRHYRPVSTLAFCNTKQQCRDLLDLLLAQGFHALTLNGDLEQWERDQVLIQFANRSCSVLVATDVAARGLDIAQLEAVINVNMTPDPEVHIHRIGRTGRAGAAGWALSLCSPADRRRAEALAATTDEVLEWHSLAGLTPADAAPLLPPMATLQLMGGRKEKIRPGDILGALTGEAGLAGDQVGKITVTDRASYVAVARAVAGQALRRLAAGKVKGRSIKVRILGD